MMLLLSAPPLGGSIVAMVGQPGRRRRRGSGEEASRSLLKAEQRAPRSQMTPSLIVLEELTLVLFGNQCG